MYLPLMTDFDDLDLTPSSPAAQPWQRHVSSDSDRAQRGQSSKQELTWTAPSRVSMFRFWFLAAGVSSGRNHVSVTDLTVFQEHEVEMLGLRLHAQEALLSGFGFRVRPCGGDAVCSV